MYLAKGWQIQVKKLNLAMPKDPKISNFTLLRDRVEKWVGRVKEDNLRQGKEPLSKVRTKAVTKLSKLATTKKEWKAIGEYRANMKKTEKKAARADIKMGAVIARFELEEQANKKWKEGPTKKTGAKRQKVAKGGGPVISPKGGFSGVGKAHFGRSGGPKIGTKKDHLRPIY